MKKYLLLLFGTCLCAGLKSQPLETFSPEKTYPDLNLFMMQKNQDAFSSSLADEERKYGQGKSAVLKSLVIPGWGLYSASGNKKAWIFLPVTYGTLGYGLYARVKGKGIYEDYKNSIDVKEVDALYTDASKFYKRSRYFVAAGVCSYLLQLGYTYIYGMRNDEYRERNQLWKSNLSINFSPEMVPNTNTMMVSTQIQFRIN